MRKSKLLAGLLSLGLLIGAGGCIVRTHGYYRASVAPPPPRHVVVSYRPGHVWVDGYWRWNGYSHVWVDGYYVAERPGYVYTQGYWHNSGRDYVYRPGAWRRGGHVQHRSNNVIIHKHHNHGRPAPHKRPVIVHDHSR